MQPRISMITLGVRDLAESVRFYEQGLRFPRVESAPNVAFFSLNGSWLGLYGRNELAADAQVSPEGGGFHFFSLAHNVGSETEVDEVFRQALEAGAKMAKKPQSVFWGGYSGYFTDPDGHLWEVAYNPLLWIGPEDAGEDSTGEDTD
jgi:catechol 2,3-dioxygenase-like lactoylglutathione lyase family enzyme